MHHCSQVQAENEEQHRLLLAEQDPEPEVGVGLDLFQIAEQKCSEMAYLAGLFFSPLGEKLFYVCMVVYLYGDLCIYAVAVPKSLVGKHATPWSIPCT